MILKYKNFEIRKEDSCYTIEKLVTYDKRESLHGPLTGETGEKRETIGYYAQLSSMVNKLAELTVNDQDSMELKDYLQQVVANQEEIKNMLK
jgi:hypothetical protein